MGGIAILYIITLLIGGRKDSKDIFGKQYPHLSESLRVGPIAAAECNVAPSVSGPTRTRSKRRIKMRKMVDRGSDDEGCGNSDCEDSLRPGEMVKCAGPSCCTQVNNQKASRSLPRG